MALKRIKNFFQKKLHITFVLPYFQPLSASEKKILRRSLFLLALLAIVWTVTFIFCDKKPVLHKIEPSIASPSEVITLKGKYLKLDSLDRIQIAGKFITDSSILKWTKTKIEIIVPDDCPSGFTYVTTTLGKSNGILFTNALHIPNATTDEHSSTSALVVSPQKIDGTVGQLIELKGERFGEFQSSSKIYFVFNGNKISLADIDPLAIEYWSDSLIRFRLPDFIFNGMLFLECYGIQTQYIPCNIYLQGATKKLGDSTTYIVSQSCNFIKKKATKETPTFTLDFPLPISSLNQTLHKISTSTKSELLASGWMRTTSKIKNSKNNTTEISRDLTVSTRAILFNLNASEVINSYDKSSFLYQYYIESNHIDGESSKTLKDVCAAIKKNNSGSLPLAKAIYDYLINRLQLDLAFSGTNEEALNSRGALAINYAELFVAMCKNLSIPARLVQGWYLCDINWIPHAWAEFYLEGVGWLCVDAFMGDEDNYSQTLIRESLNDSFKAREGFNLKDFYFGNFSGTRIIFHKGQERLKNSYKFSSLPWKVAKDRQPSHFEISKNSALIDFEAYFSSDSSNFNIATKIISKS